MEFEFKENKIKFERVLSNLDTFVIRFVNLLDSCGIKYVIVSGYVPILFGRSRNTEDVDILIEEMELDKFKRFWDELPSKGFECINAFNAKEAYTDFLADGYAIRFFDRIPIPNIELKFAKGAVHEYTLNNPLEVTIGKNKLLISPIELQIAYKFLLGSDKDIEDAVHLWRVFKGKLSTDKLCSWMDKLNVDKEKYLKILCE